jgi:serpin B
LRQPPDFDNDFALAMYGQLRDRPGNLFFSPFSIRMAFGMVCAGARGETAAQMREALRIPSSDEAIQQVQAASGGKYELAVANSLWGQVGSPIEPEFLELITRRYGGGMSLLDFRHAAEAARGTINRWVEERTKQKIRDLIPPGGVSGETRLVLVNAVYFKGLWELPFRKAATRDEPFHLEGGGTVPARLMRQQSNVLYMQGEDYQAVDLVYQGDDLSLLVLLPDRVDGLRALEEKLSARKLHDCVARLKVGEVRLFLPRFKITWGTVNLRKPLKALGIRLAFERFRADFSGINGYVPPHEEALFLSSVFHKAFIEVDEEGTEAAAATGATMALAGSAFRTPPPVPVFRADHPFLFAIRDRRSGAILFLGRVVELLPASR